MKHLNVRYISGEASLTQEEDGKRNREHIGQIVEAGQELRHILTEASSPKQVDRVHSNHSDADELLHDLQPDSENRAPSELPAIFVFWEDHGSIVIY